MPDNNHTFSLPDNPNYEVSRTWKPDGDGFNEVTYTVTDKATGERSTFTTNTDYPLDKFDAQVSEQMGKAISSEKGASLNQVADKAVYGVNNNPEFMDHGQIEEPKAIEPIKPAAPAAAQEAPPAKEAEKPAATQQPAAENSAPPAPSEPVQRAPLSAEQQAEYRATRSDDLNVVTRTQEIAAKVLDPNNPELAKYRESPTRENLDNLNNAVKARAEEIRQEVADINKKSPNDITPQDREALRGHQSALGTIGNEWTEINEGARGASDRVTRINQIDNPPEPHAGRGGMRLPEGWDDRGKQAGSVNVDIVREAGSEVGKNLGKANMVAGATGMTQAIMEGRYGDAAVEAVQTGLGVVADVLPKRGPGLGMAGAALDMGKEMHSKYQETEDVTETAKAGAKTGAELGVYAVGGMVATKLVGGAAVAAGTKIMVAAAAGAVIGKGIDHATGFSENMETGLDKIDDLNQANQMKVNPHTRTSVVNDIVNFEKLNEVGSNLRVRRGDKAEDFDKPLSSGELRMHIAEMRKEAQNLSGGTITNRVLSAIGSPDMSPRGQALARLDAAEQELNVYENDYNREMAAKQKPVLADKDKKEPEKGNMQAAVEQAKQEVPTQKLDQSGTPPLDRNPALAQNEPPYVQQKGAVEQQRMV